MATHSITNIDVGPRGFWHQDAVVLVDPKQTVDVSDMTADEVKAAKATGYFKLDGASAGSADEPGPLDQSVEKLTEYLKSVNDADHVQKLIDAETEGKSRTGALAALKERQDAILAA